MNQVFIRLNELTKEDLFKLEFLFKKELLNILTEEKCLSIIEDLLKERKSEKEISDINNKVKIKVNKLFLLEKSIDIKNLLKEILKTHFDIQVKTKEEDMLLFSLSKILKIFDNISDSFLNILKENLFRRGIVIKINHKKSFLPEEVELEIIQRKRKNNKKLKTLILNLLMDPSIDVEIVFKDNNTIIKNMSIIQGDKIFELEKSFNILSNIDDKTFKKNISSIIEDIDSLKIEMNLTFDKFLKLNNIKI